MRVLKRSRKKPQVGDVFALKIEDELYHWGLVVSTTARIGGFDDCILIYIYSVTTIARNEVPKLALADLLLPPIATNELPWRKGFFETVCNQPLTEFELLPVHCFKSVAFGRYFDDMGRPLEGESEPCGIYGLDSYQTIDDKISEALGLALTPD